MILFHPQMCCRQVSLKSVLQQMRTDRRFPFLLNGEIGRLTIRLMHGAQRTSGFQSFVVFGMKTVTGSYLSFTICMS